MTITIPEVALGHAKVWSIRELTEQTADIVAGVVESGAPAIVSRHGRLVVTIQRVPTGSEEALLRLAAADPLTTRLGRLRPDGTADALTSDSVLEQGEAREAGQSSAPESPAHGGPQVVSMRDLNQHTSRIVAQVRDAQRPAVITRRGRIHAAMIPLPPNLESQLLALPEARDLIGSLERIGVNGTAAVMTADRIIDR